MKKVKKILTFGLACTMILVLAACESLIPAPVIPPDEASEAEESAESSAEGNMNMPNPWVECDTLEEAVKLAGFNIEVPVMIEGYSSNMIQAMMTNGPVLILTQGGPARSTTTLIYLMYTSGYGSSNYSLAACVSVIAFLLTLVFTLLIFTTEKGRVHYQ